MSTHLSPTVAGYVADARTKTSNEAYLAQADCIDWLLDCWNAAVRPAVRSVVGEILAEFRHVSLVTSRDFDRALDHIQMALQVDAAFDHLQVGSGRVVIPQV